MTDQTVKKTVITAIPLLVAVVALPPALWLIVALYPGGMTLAEVFSAVTFRIFTVIFGLLLLLQLIASLLRRSVAASFLSAAFILLLVQGVVWYGFRFTGEAGAGTGDQIIDYHREERGPWSGDSRIPARVELIPAKSTDPVEFSFADKRVKVPLKGSFDWKRYQLTPLAVEQAPLMTLETFRGEQIESLYIKMGTVPSERDFFLVKTLPHRIYIAPDRDQGIKLRIIRDKIEIVATTVVWGEKLPYDGHYISFMKGEPWLRIAVRKRVAIWPGVAGGFMLLAGGVSYLVQKRRLQC